MGRMFVGRGIAKMAGRIFVGSRGHLCRMLGEGKMFFRG